MIFLLCQTIVFTYCHILVKLTRLSSRRLLSDVSNFDLHVEQASPS